MGRLIFVNRFYWPDEPATGQLLTDLAERLAAAGHDVVVLASFGGTLDRPAREVRAGVQIVRVGGPAGTQTEASAKARAWGTFLVSAAWRLVREVRRGDVVIAMTDPPFLGIAAWLAARVRGARLMHWVQDIYPELAIKLARQRWLTTVRPLRNAAWRAADHCVTVGQDMAATIRAAGVPPSDIAVVANWAPAGLQPPDADTLGQLRRAWHLEGKFVVAYSGNLGRVHDLEFLLPCADALRGDDSIAFLVIGHGAQRPTLEADARRLGLANVHFHPPQPRGALGASLAVADVHLVTLRPGCERLVYPSKLYGIAAVGRPVLFVGPPACELAREVRARGMGIVVKNGDIDACNAAIRRLACAAEERVAMARAALGFASLHSVERATQDWMHLLAQQKSC